MTNSFPFRRIADIVRDEGTRLESEFFNEKLDSAFENARCQIAKFESRQEYSEGPDFDTVLEQEGAAGAMKLVEPFVDETVTQFKDFEKRGVRFLRCRPLVFPLSEYMNVQVEVYRKTAHSAAQMLWFNIKSAEDLVRNFATHDFMVFDTRLALIYEHDKAGEFIGGWEVEKPEAIAEMIALFGLFSAQSLPLLKLAEK